MSPAPIAVFPLRPPQPIVRGWIFVLLGFIVVPLTTGLGGIAANALVASDRSASTGFLLGAALGLWLMVGPLRRANRASGEARTIHIQPNGLLIPDLQRGSGPQLIPFETIEEIDLHGRSAALAVVIRAADRAFVIPARSFAGPDEALRFVAEAQRALAVHSPELSRNLERQRAITAAVLRVRPVATWLLLGLIALGFAVTLALGGPTVPVLLRLGANAPALERSGQWFRLFTANFLHGGWLHLYLNGMALLTLGSTVERLFGTTRYVVVFLLSALGGSAASALHGTHLLSIGSSTALFGLFGAWAYAAWRFRGNLPPGFRRSRRWWLVQLGLNGALAVAIPMIDWAAHVGGFFAGGIAAALVLAPARGLGDPPGQLSRIAALTLVAIYAGALWQGAQYALGPTDFAGDAARAMTELHRARP